MRVRNSIDGLSEKEKLEIQRDEVKYWYDVLHKPTISKIAKRTKFSAEFVWNAICGYKTKCK